MNNIIIKNATDKAKNFGILKGMVGGEKKGFITPKGDFIFSESYGSHDSLSKAFGFSGAKELINAGMVRASHTDYDMNYEVAHGNAGGIENINASISWNIGTDRWPSKADILIDVAGIGSRRITIEEFINSEGDIRMLLSEVKEERL